MANLARICWIRRFPKVPKLHGGASWGAGSTNRRTSYGFLTLPVAPSEGGRELSNRSDRSEGDPIRRSCLEVVGMGIISLVRGRWRMGDLMVESSK